MTSQELKIGGYYQIIDRKYSWYGFVGVYTGKNDTHYRFRKPDGEYAELQINDREQHEGQDGQVIEETDKQTYLEELNKEIKKLEDSIESTMEKYANLCEYKKSVKVPELLKTLFKLNQ